MKPNKININPKLIPNKLPLENVEPSEEELRYYLSNWEYNELLTAVLELIDDYNEKLASGWETLSIIKSTDNIEASDTTVYSSLKSKKKFAVAPNPGMQKIYNNFDIISNNVEPNSFIYEVVGDGYDWSDLKSSIESIGEETKMLEGSSSVFDYLFDISFTGNN